MFSFQFWTHFNFKLSYHSLRIRFPVIKSLWMLLPKKILIVTALVTNFTAINPKPNIDITNGLTYYNILLRVHEHIYMLLYEYRHIIIFYVLTGDCPKCYKLLPLQYTMTWAQLELFCWPVYYNKEQYLTYLWHFCTACNIVIII